MIHLQSLTGIFTLQAHYYSPDYETNTMWSIPILKSSYFKDSLGLFTGIYIYSCQNQYLIVSMSLKYDGNKKGYKGSLKVCLLDKVIPNNYSINVNFIKIVFG